MFVGFQAAGTRGRLLSEGARQIRIFGVDYPVRAEVHVIDSFSAHGDYSRNSEVAEADSNGRLAKHFLFMASPEAIDGMREHIARLSKTGRLKRRPIGKCSNSKNTGTARG